MNIYKNNAFCDLLWPDYYILYKIFKKVAISKHFNEFLFEATDIWRVIMRLTIVSSDISLLVHAMLNHQD